MMSNQKTVLIIFAREPEDGKVKKRLRKDLPPPVVTRLYKAFVKDVVQTALEAKCDERMIFYTGTSSSAPFLRSFQNRFQLKRQAGKDLGIRMHRAFAYSHKQHFGKIIIIGTDCLTLAAKDIKKAFKQLGSHDCVLGPSKDGGYYLIGLKVPESRLFVRIDWGTSSVLAQTICQARKLRKKTFLLGKKEDIDTISDLRRLLRRVRNADTAAHTQNVAQKIKKFIS
jgi:rSAM/selenodomain-associated transferase 1